MSQDTPENEPLASPAGPQEQSGPQPPPYHRPYGGPPPGPYGGPPPGPYGPPPHPQHPAWRPPPGYGPPVDPTLAEFWQRLVARLLDCVVVALVMSPLWIWFFVWYSGQMSGLMSVDAEDPAQVRRLLHTELRLMGVSLLFGGIAALLFFVYDWFQHAKWGQTIGKRIVKIKVVALPERAPVTGGAAFKRAALYALAPQVPIFGSIFGLLDSLWLLWDKPNRQCLHDKVADTVVIRTEIDVPAGGPRT
jgi:uncharacterized RDD family membrane protein YckC